MWLKKAYVVMNKKCTKCGKYKPLEEYHKKSKGLYGVASICKQCWVKISRDSKEKSRKKTQKWIIDYLEKHPCKHCGETDILVLEFNHMENKKLAVSKLVSECYSLNTIKKEVDKCEVLCCNCHKRYTSKQLNSYRWRYLNDK